MRVGPLSQAFRITRRNPPLHLCPEANLPYANAQIMALKVAFAALAFFARLALWYVQSLPNRADGAKPADAPATAGEPTAETNG